ncbi:MAG TPA: hypothetical protein VGB28_05635 [Actinomycetota bacterium]
MRRTLLGVCAAGTLILPAPGHASQPALVVFLPPTSLRAALDAPLPGSLARAGGVGLLTAPGQGDPVAAARAAIPAGMVVEDPGLLLRRVGEAAGPVVVLVIAPLDGSERRDVALLILARGDPQRLFYAHGPVRGLTSDTTRRPGLVSTADLPEALGTGRGAGSTIRVEGAPPFRLVDRYRALAPLRAPAGLTVLGLALLGLVMGIALMFGRAPRPRILRAAGGLGLFAVALPVALLPAAALPRPSALSVAGVALGGGAILAWAAHRVAGPGPAAMAVVAGAGMGVVIVDGFLGWPGMLMPLIGGSAFEGSRMYGLGNGYGGLLVAGAVLAASRLRPVPGVLLLAAAGLLGGLPGFGANLGVATTLFVAVGAWLALRVLGGPRLLPVAAGAGLAAAGVAAVLAIHRAADLPTHVTRVLEAAGRSGLGEILDVYVRRLALNLEGTAASPAAWLVLVALPVALVMAWRRSRPFGSALTADPGWRDAVVVLAVASMAGYLANDTIGVAGMGFVYVAAALVYPSLAMRWT